MIGNQLPQPCADLLRRVERGIRLLINHLDGKTALSVIVAFFGHKQLAVEKSFALVGFRYAAENFCKRRFSDAARAQYADYTSVWNGHRNII